MKVFNAQQAGVIAESTYEQEKAIYEAITHNREIFYEKKDCRGCGWWAVLGKMLFDKDIDPEEHVRFAFAINPTAQCLKPKQLGQGPVLSVLSSGTAEEMLRSRISSALRQESQRLGDELISLEFDFPQLTQKQRLKIVLSDDALDTSSLIRYTIAVAEKLGSVARANRLAAAVEYYRFRRLYDAVWKTRIPPQLKGRAREWFEQALVRTR